MRARFTAQQLPVKVVQKDGMAYVYICVNETEGTETYPDMGEGQAEEHYYEYDYNEIIAPVDKLDLDDMQENPVEYLEYEYKPSASSYDLEEIMKRLLSLEKNQTQMDSVFDEVVSNGY